MKKEKLLEMLQCSDLPSIELACSIWIREFGIRELDEISKPYQGSVSYRCITRYIVHNAYFDKNEERAIFIKDNVALLLYSGTIYTIDNLSSFIEKYEYDWNGVAEKRRFRYEREDIANDEILR